MFTQEKELPLFQFGNLHANGVCTHFISGRQGGVSEGETSSLNLSFSVPDKKENVWENRRRIAVHLGIGTDRLIFPAQTHSDHIGIVTEKNYSSGFPDTDALITDVPGICIAVMAADCVPILLFDPERKLVAAVHSGWRGTIKKIVRKTLESMTVKFGSDPGNITAGIGPSIGQMHYEVGTEVIEAVEHSFGKKNDLIKASKPGKGYLDLWKANEMLLLQAGVKQKNIEIAAICTYENDQHYFSARRSAESGRFAAGIMI